MLQRRHGKWMRPLLSSQRQRGHHLPITSYTFLSHKAFPYNVGITYLQLGYATKDCSLNSSCSVGGQPDMSALILIH